MRNVEAGIDTPQKRVTGVREVEPDLVLPAGPGARLDEGGPGAADHLDALGAPGVLLVLSVSADKSLDSVLAPLLAGALIAAACGGSDDDSGDGGSGTEAPADTEAPAEMNTWFPQFKVFWAAENITGTIHNIYTLRGALVRDALEWSKQINRALYLFGQEAEVMFASHSWPRWGNKRIQEVMRAQRDTYANLNNGVLHLANQGVTNGCSMTLAPCAIVNKYLDIAREQSGNPRRTQRAGQ